MSASVLLIFNIVALTIAMTLLAMALSVGVRDFDTSIHYSAEEPSVHSRTSRRTEGRLKAIPTVSRSTVSSLRPAGTYWKAGLHSE